MKMSIEQLTKFQAQDSNCFSFFFISLVYAMFGTLVDCKNTCEIKIYMNELQSLCRDKEEKEISTRKEDIIK